MFENVKSGGGFKIGDVVRFVGVPGLSAQGRLIVRTIRKMTCTSGAVYYRLDTVKTNAYPAIEGASRWFEHSTLREQ